MSREYCVCEADFKSFALCFARDKKNFDIRRVLTLTDKYPEPKIWVSTKLIVIVIFLFSSFYQN